jgi:putative ABC transport system permease protein
MIRIGEVPGAGDVAPIDVRTPAELEHLGDVVAQIATTLDARVLDVEVATSSEFEGFDGLPAVVVGTPTETDDRGTSYRVLSHLYVASPELLEYYGLDQAEVDPQADVLTTQTGDLFLLPMRDEPVDNAQQLSPTYTSLPGTFVTSEAIANRGWTPAQAGWLLEAAAPVTAEQITDIRETAAAAGITVEARHDQRNLATLRTGAAGVGALVALAIMAMTVGLVRSEVAGDVRILTASGATSSNRRTLTAATAGGLALLGTVLGVAGGYLGLGAVHSGDLGTLTPVPVLHLLALALGLPLVAAVGGWVLAGRAPAWLGRQPLD